MPPTIKEKDPLSSTIAPEDNNVHDLHFHNVVMPIDEEDFMDFELTGF